MAIRLQELIHKLEEGSGYRYLKFALGLIAMVALVVTYDGMAFRNLSTQEGMDAAQLGRNIAEGRGYTTKFIRPFSIHLVQRAVAKKLEQLQKAAPDQAERKPDGQQEKLLRLMRLQEDHPDLANAPLYPVILAGVLKIMPFAYPELSADKFSTYAPDLWIALFNQFLFLVAVVMVFRLALKLFDEPVAWVTAIVCLGAELLWRFSISGFCTMLLVVIFLGLARVLVWLEAALREGQRSLTWHVFMAVAAGALVGLGGLTRYSFGWLIIPVVVVLAIWAGQKRGPLVAASVAAFLIVMTPWIIRNYQVSGTPFGIAGFAVCQDTTLFSEDHLERSLNPDFSGMNLAVFVRKVVINCRELIQNDLPKLGGSWMSAFFLVGLLMPFKNPALGRLRWFLVLCLAVLAFAQALGRTRASASSLEISSENLVVLLAPLIFAYGVSLFFILLDQLRFPHAAVRYGIIGFFGLVMSASLLLTLLPPRRTTIAYPPYFPPWIQEKSQLMQERELIMSDLPWAVAWYGDRESVWLTLKYKSAPTEKRKNDFYEINDYLKPIKALYLTAQTLKSVEIRAVLNWARGASAEEDWEMFVLGTYLKREVPSGFPLKRAPEGLIPELFLTDTERGRAKTIQSQ